MPGHRIARDHFVRCQTNTSAYARSREYHSLTDETKIFWQYDRQKAWLQPWKVTIVADDRKGLSFNSIEHVLKYCRSYNFLVIEIAFDFRPEVGVDRRFVRQHAVFGKSRRRERKRTGSNSVLGRKEM